jgi:ferrous iron transport protein B
MRTVALVGNPNSGKTTLFNALTGSTGRVGNWSGVTVGRHEAVCHYDDASFDVVDLPGTYSLNVISDLLGLDERLVCEFLANNSADVYLNVVDASQLERQLYLTLQLLESNVPIIVVLTMMDQVNREGKTIDCAALSKSLQCPVYPLEAMNELSLEELKSLLHTTTEASVSPVTFSPSVESSIAELTKKMKKKASSRAVAARILEGDLLSRTLVPNEVLEVAKGIKTSHEQKGEEDLDMLIADHRYRWISETLKAMVQEIKSDKPTITERIDNIVLHRFLGVPIFFGVMYLLFFFAINIGGAFQDFFDLASHAIFVSGVASTLSSVGVPAWLNVILSEGVGKGINTTLTFIPVIASMYLFLSMLELSGYMVRAAFVMDRLMRFLGLPGKSFVPLIVGFGCNVPAVMAARTLTHQRDRILTIVMSPFMSCGARLSIFAVFTSAFFPEGGQNVVFALYLIGILIAVLTGMMLRKTVLRGPSAPLVMEIPRYHLPPLRRLLHQTWHRLRGFVIKAGRLIVPVCVLLGGLNAVTFEGGVSLLEIFGRGITPLLAPMGVGQDNWPATVGLLTGILSKEVVIGSLNTLYQHSGHVTLGGASGGIMHELWRAVLSIPHNLMHLGHAFSNPVAGAAPLARFSSGTMGQMYHCFSGKIAAFAYLLFVLLYIPCVSTVAVILRELNWQWALFSVAWSTGLAYSISVFFYQASVFSIHPKYSLLCMLCVVGFFVFTITVLRFQSALSHPIKKGERYDPV